MCFNLPVLISPIDINECAVNNGNCGSTRVCANTAGSFGCQTGTKKNYYLIFIQSRDKISTGCGRAIVFMTSDII